MRDENKGYTVAIFDMNRLEIGIAQPASIIPSPICLFLKTRNEEDLDEIIEYIPPHPDRGTGVHNILIAVYEHDKACRAKFGKCYSDRKFTARDLELTLGGRIVGYNFFRTIWTKEVTEIIMPKHGIEDKVYGHVVNTRPQKIPSRYAYC